MTETHPITPPEALVLSLRNSAPHGIRDAGVTREIWLIEHAYALGADQELEACAKHLKHDLCFADSTIELLRAARRPKPPSLKEQALAALKRQAVRSVPSLIATEDCDTIRRALKALPND
jgi:hypothetical protein